MMCNIVWYLMSLLVYYCEGKDKAKCLPAVQGTLKQDIYTASARLDSSESYRRLINDR